MGVVDGPSGVSFGDRGLAYGDGMFETILVRDGTPMLWKYHVARLHDGGRRLGISLPSEKALHDAMAAACSQVQGDAVFKLIVTRGEGGRGYLPPSVAEPAWQCRAVPFDANTACWQGITARLCHLVLSDQPALAGIKHLSRLENVMARREWTDPRIAEGLLLDARGELVEGTCMNVAWCEQGQWFTPGLRHSGVAGTLRAALLDAGFLAISAIDTAGLSHSDAVVVFNSVQGVWPLERLMGSDGQLLAEWNDLALHRTFQHDAHPFLGYPSLIQ
ncbi:aminodeoxychorismate lyase [Larsenimonas rhizosphaerae]|uniref:aminodeoxychorismate lyase n=1 Tax=Larsenimonas rhizosphaerae TaxID=2944682 RepID=UPI002033E0F8|nr:aminodeoxychorismate lyase [Larsenimonas rhizosphaerae]MCM2130959.1 aminodeoxychorismate lyase [Larsenimonas rhizosphaerae]